MKPALARCVLGGVFLVASVGKILHPADFAQSIANYDLVTPVAPLLAVLLPWLEATAGLLLILGFLTRGSALVLGGLSAGFGVAVSIALARGLNIECGCIGNETVGWTHPVVNLALVGLAFYVLRHGPGRWALDNRAVRAPETLAESKAKRKRKKK